MADASQDMTNQVKLNGLTLEYLVYYKHMVMELLSRKDDFLLPFLGSDSGLLESDIKEKYSKSSVVGIFQEGLVTGVSDFEREKLKGILNESFTCLNMEADKILDGILATFRIGTFINDHIESTECKKRRISPCSSCNRFFSEAAGSKSPQSCGKQVYSDFQGYIGEGIPPKEALERCSNSLMDKLNYLEHFLEEYLDVTLSKCRPMTTAEKQQLGQRIHKLPASALDRVAEIIQHRKSFAKDPTNKIIHVNLVEEDDLTLWRLYCYVETVAKTGKQRLGSRTMQP